MNSEGSCPAVSCPLRTLCIVSLLFLSNNLSILSNIDCNFLIALVVIFLIILIFGSPLCKPSVKPTKKTRFFSLSSLKYGLLWMFKVFHVFLCHDDVIYWPKTPHLYWLLFWFFFLFNFLFGFSRWLIFWPATTTTTIPPPALTTTFFLAILSIPYIN